MAVKEGKQINRKSLRYTSKEFAEIQSLRRTAEVSAFISLQTNHDDEVSAIQVEYSVEKKRLQRIEFVKAVISPNPQVFATCW